MVLAEAGVLPCSLIALCMINSGIPDVSELCLSHLHHITEAEERCQCLDRWLFGSSRIVTASFCFLSWTEVSRLWIIYFDLKVLKCGSEIISIFSAKDCCLKNQHIIGNKRWLIPRVLVSLAVVSVLNAIRMVQAFCQVIPLVFIGVIYCKTDKSQTDNLMLQYEFKKTYILLLIVVTVSILLFSMSAHSLFPTVWIPLRIKNSGQWNGRLLLETITLTNGIFQNRRMDKDGNTARNWTLPSVAAPKWISSSIG